MDEDLLERAIKIMKENGDITEKTKVGLITLVLQDLRDDIHTMCASTSDYHKTIDTYLKAHETQHHQIDLEIKELKRNNLLLWIKDNKMLFAFIVILFLTTSNIIRGVLLLIGVPSIIIP